MKALVLLVFAAASALAADSLTLYEVDGVVQSSRPVTLGRVFAQGEIAGCPQPVVGGVGVTNYQADVKNRWGDGSVKFAVISFTQTLAAGSGTAVTFQNAASCNNTGYLTLAQMQGFNGGNWGASLEVTAPGVPVVVRNAATMLGHSDPETAPECGNHYWLQGPVVTQVIVQDCTPALAYDFGFKNKQVTTVTGGSLSATQTSVTVTYAADIASLALPTVVTVDSEQMNVTGVSGNTLTVVRGVNGTAAAYHANGSVVSSNAQPSTWEAAPSSLFNSLHPIFILSFYPSLNSVKVDYIVEDLWTGKMQDQAYAFVLKAGNPLAQVYAHSQFTHIGKTRWRKTFWSGLGVGHLRIDHDFAYLMATKALPNYDPSVGVNPAGDYASFAAGDLGDIGGVGLLNKSYADNNEGAPLQREDLEYLYNMGSCGTANGACAQAWYILTGERGALDTSLAASVAGGAGMWTGMGNVPYHYRESRAGGSFYCAGYADKNAVPASGCGAGTGSPVGRAFSRHANPQDQIVGLNVTGLPVVGSTTWGGWSVGDCSHWLDYSYTPYVLTGDYYFLDDEYLSAAFCVAGYNSGNGKWQSNGFYGFMNPSYYTVVRQFAWGMQTVGRAAFLAPDGTAESSYFTSMVNSNLEVLEGFMQISGTTLTPASTNASCSGYDANTANRWDWGRCTVGQNLSQALHTLTGGECPTSAVSGFVDPSKATDFESTWQYWFASLALSHLKELGFGQVTSVVTQTWQRAIEMVEDPGFNPYLVGNYEQGIKNGAAACSGTDSTTNPYFTSWAQVKAALPAAEQTVSTFQHAPTPGAPADPPWGNYPCADHGYSLLARAVGTYIGSTTSGSFNGAAAWNWLNANVPYYSACGDAIIKFALAPRAGP
jgi:hypothetical protein